MASLFLISVVILCSPLLLTNVPSVNAQYYYQTYVVRAPVGGKPSQYATSKDWYLSILTSVANPDADVHITQRLLYAYENVFPGFAAALTYDEQQRLSNVVGSSFVYYDNSGSVQTTRTPSFLGLTSPPPGTAGIWNAANRGQNAIVGVLDTGVWPESSSFSDAGYSPIPARWKGTCEPYPSFDPSKACNRKLIGARAFYLGYKNSFSTLNETVEFRSPRDSVGHGTHVASISVGSAVQNASFFGSASGLASGMAPLARLAVYKVCWQPEWSGPDYAFCYMSDILAGFEAAIADGVDVISAAISLYSWEYLSDAISLGAFAAELKGIITTAPAGNTGYGTTNGVQNLAPWTLTVGASTVDRRFQAPVKLGNGTTLSGISFYANTGFGNSPVGVIYAGDPAAAAENVSTYDLWRVSYCADSNLFNKAAIKNKVVICETRLADNYIMGNAVIEAGGIGMIVIGYSYDDNGLYTTNGAAELSPPSLPTTFMSYISGSIIREYANGSSSNPTVVIQFQGTQLGTKPAPQVPSFSGRGPNPMTPEILKPNVVAPGVNILGAFTGARGPSGRDDPRKVDFNILTGTSMSCAHAAGVAALLKAAHPDWSPAAIKSAMMTTASTQDNTGNAIIDAVTNKTAYALALGSGQINPNAALNPGLIYDISPVDYLKFLCSINYTNPMLYNFIGTASIYANFSCDSSAKTRPGELNYPSFGVVYNYPNTNAKLSATFSRTVTNVGPLGSIYTVSVDPPPYVQVSVSPSKLHFKSTNQKLSYSVTFSADPLQLVPEYGSARAFTLGSLTWTDTKTKTSVTSPILFTWVQG